MPVYIVKGKVAVLRYIKEEQIIEAVSPASARAKFRLAMTHHGGSVIIQSCAEEGKGGQGSLKTGGDRPA